MNEFKQMNKENLKIYKLGLEAYRQGAIDTYGIIIDTATNTLQKTKEYYDAKIAECEAEIVKHERT